MSSVRCRNASPGFAGSALRFGPMASASPPRMISSPGAEVVLDFRVGSGTPGLVRLGPRDRLWIWGGVSATSWGRYEVLWAASSGRLADELGERDAPVVVFRVEWDDGRDDVLDPGLEEIRAAIAAIADAAGCAFEGLNP